MSENTTRIFERSRKNDDPFPIGNPTCNRLVFAKFPEQPLYFLGGFQLIPNGTVKGFNGAVYERFPLENDGSFDVAGR
jgi:hypothetical protein